MKDFSTKFLRSSISVGAGIKTPKIDFFLVSTNFSYVFERVKNIYGGIPRHWDILKEPSDH